MRTSVTIPNVNIGDCDYTIAFWIRLSGTNNYARIWGESRSGKALYLHISRLFAIFCHQVSTTSLRGVGNYSYGFKSWTHIAVTCEQDNRLKMFFNGELAKVSSSGAPNIPPDETFVIKYSSLILDLHILGFALPRDEIYDLYRG